MAADLEKIINSELEKYPEAGIFLAAVSGGADSMAMFAAMCVVVSKERLFCLHVDHKLRAEESKADAEFVRDFCEKQNVAYRIVSVPQGKIESYARDKGVGIEAAARYFRQRALVKEAVRLGDQTLILTAHTKDDVLELALMRILRGAGPAGLSLMPIKKGRFLRPLLSINRTDVITYLKQKNISWREDLSNKEDIFLRNKVRLRLIPILNDFFPNWAKGLSGMAETQSLAAEFLVQEARRCISWEHSIDSFVTCAENFFSQPQIIREEAVFLGINLYTSSSVPKRSVIRRFCKGLITSADLGLVQIKHESGRIVLSSIQDKNCENGFSLLIKEKGLYNLNNIQIEVCPASAQDGENSFVAFLPLVLRQFFKDDVIENMGKKVNKQGLNKQGLNKQGLNKQSLNKQGLKDDRIISVIDQHGTAAFIGSRGILAKRELPELNDCNECSLIVVSNI